jgi:hypothetical protein
MRARRHQSLSSGIDYGAESFQGMRPQEAQVAALRENNFIHGFEVVNPENRVTNIAR